MALRLLHRFRTSEEIFKWNIKYLFIVGLWPNDDFTKTQKILYKMYEFICFCFSIIYLVIISIGTYQSRSDLTIFLTNVDKSLVAYHYFLKVLVFLKRRRSYRSLVEDISACSDEVSEETKKKMVHHLLAITLFNSFIILCFLIIGVFKREMRIEAWMPFDVTKSTMNLVLSMQIVGGLYCIPFSFRAVGMQGIICSILIYLCVQLESLQEQIRDVHYSKENEKEARLKLRDIAVKHIRLMRYANTMEGIFREYFLVQNLAIILELCLSAVLVTIMGVQDKSIISGFLGILGLGLLNAYIYCKLGNKLIEQSEGIAFAAYSSEWPSWPMDVQKNILLTITAANRPLQLTAGGVVPISMKTFGIALYNGYSTFAVLKDVVNK